MPPERAFRLHDTHRLIPSRYPPVGLLDAVASWDDLNLLFELESWTNDRLSVELGLLHIMPSSEWVIGKPMSSVIMAAFCHPRAEGSRFSGPERGAWYAALTLEAAQAENIYHRTAYLAEVGVNENRMQMRQYLADFDTEFHDIRAPLAENEPYHDPASYVASQKLGRDLLDNGSNGLVYRCVRYPGGECVVCFWPKLIRNVRAGAHFEYRWHGSSEVTIHRPRAH